MTTDRHGHRIREGDFIRVRPVNVARYEELDHLDPRSQIVGRVRLLMPFGQQGVGIVQWPAVADEDDRESGMPPLLLEDYFRCEEAEVLLKANGLPPG